MARPRATRAGGDDRCYPARHPTGGWSPLPFCDAVAHPEHGLEQAGRSRIALDLAPDVLDVGIDGALVGGDRDAVNRVEQLRTGEDATGLAGHVEQQLELRPSEGHLPAVYR